MSNNNYNPDDVNLLTEADEIIDWSVLEGKNPWVNEEYRQWMQQHHEKYTEYIHEQIQEKKIEAMVDKITDLCVREGKNPYKDTDAEEMMDDEMRVWWQQHRYKYGMKLNIENEIKRKIKKRNSNRKTVATAVSLPVEYNVIQKINQARRHINNTGGGRKSKNTGKKSKNKKKHIIPIKIKKEIKNLTKDWINSLPNKKIYSKKNVNKFIKTLKKKCANLY